MIFGGLIFLIGWIGLLFFSSIEVDRFSSVANLQLLTIWSMVIVSGIGIFLWGCIAECLEGMSQELRSRPSPSNEDIVNELRNLAFSHPAEGRKWLLAHELRMLEEKVKKHGMSRGDDYRMTQLKEMLNAA